MSGKCSSHKDLGGAQTLGGFKNKIALSEEENSSVNLDINTLWSSSSVLIYYIDLIIT